MTRSAARFLARLRRDGESGFTLAELMVTMVLMGIVGSVVLAAVVSVTKTVTHNQANADSLDIARVGINNMTKTIRSGMEIERTTPPNKPALASIAPNAIVLYGSLGATPTEITYSIDASRNLVEKRRAASGTAPYWTFTGTGTTRVVASLIPTGADPLFVYRDGSGAVLPIQTSITEADLTLVRQVQITLTVDANPAQGGGPVTLTNTVVLPNLGVTKR